MNIQKLIPLLLPAIFVIAVAFYACSTSKSPSGTPGSPRDTTGVQAVGSKTLTDGTPGSPRDTTSIKKN